MKGLNLLQMGEQVVFAPVWERFTKEMVDYIMWKFAKFPHASGYCTYDRSTDMLVIAAPFSEYVYFIPMDVLRGENDFIMRYPLEATAGIGKFRRWQLNIKFVLEASLEDLDMRSIQAHFGEQKLTDSVQGWTSIPTMGNMLRVDINKIQKEASKWHPEYRMRGLSLCES